METPRYHCKACNVTFVRKGFLEAHIHSSRHKKMAFMQKKTTPQSVEIEAEQSLIDDDNSVKSMQEQSASFAYEHLDTQQQDASTERNFRRRESDDEASRENVHSWINDSDWYPFRAKSEFLLYCLMHSSTHFVSDEIVKFVLFMMAECGVEVPTLATLKNHQFGDIKWESMLSRGQDERGNPFWMVRPSELIKLSMAHPETANSIERYPRNSHTLSHQADASRWRELPINALSFAKGGIYCSSSIKTLVKVQYFQDNMELDILEAVVQKVVDGSWFGLTNRSLVICDTYLTVPVNDLHHQFEPLQEDIPIYQETETGMVLLSPEKNIEFRELFNKEMPEETVMVPINIFIDDTSANKSRRWKALHCMQMQLAGLPLSQRQKSRNIKYLCASEKVDVMVMGSSIIDDLKSMSDGVAAFDAKNKKECLVKGCLDIIVADNSMVSYCCNHMGAAAKKFCPRCNATAETFNTITNPRTLQQTQHSLQRIELRGTEARKKEKRKATGLKEHFNCFWGILNPHSDIPVGMLHLVPLGLAKHLVAHLIKTISANEINKMATMLESMSGKEYQTFFDNFHSRQGKDLKEYLQLAPLSLKICNAERKYVRMMTCLSKIQVILLKDNFSQMDIQDVSDLVTQYMGYVSRYVPSLAKKAKTHMLLHIVDDISNHGPPKGFCEDAFEKKHAAIREELFNQNQKAPSRDLAVDFAKSTLLNHVVSGGYFLKGGLWTQASLKVQEMFTYTPLSKHLGDQKEKAVRVPGVVKKLQRNKGKRPMETIVDEADALQLGLDENNEDLKIIIGKSITSKNGELINQGQWMKYLDGDEEGYGVLLKGIIVVETGKRTNKVKLQKAQVQEEKFIGCLQISKSDVTYIDCKLVLASAEVFHDCLGGNCRTVEKEFEVRVEHEIIKKRVKKIKHNEDHNKYIINRFRLSS